MINDKVCGIAALVDYLKLAINYYGFGYEKNLTIDLDHTPNSIGNGNNGEIDKFKYGLQFGKRTPIETDKPGGLENQICFTENRKNIFLKEIINKVLTHEQYKEYLMPPKQSSYSFIKDEIGNYIDKLEYAMRSGDSNLIKAAENEIKTKFQLSDPQDFLKIKIQDNEDRMERGDPNQSSYIGNFNEQSKPLNMMKHDYWPQNGTELYKNNQVRLSLSNETNAAKNTGLGG